MSKEAMKLALEALETERENYQDWDKQDGAPEYIYEAITALREALVEPDFWEGYVPEPVKPAQQALDKKAENARELGLDYEPSAGTQVSKVWWDGEKLMAKPIPLKDFYEPARQEPVACQYAQDVAMPEYRCVGRCQYDTFPPAQQEPVAHAVIAGALFDFMGWLTSRKERLVLSSADNASPAVEAITEFAKMRGLSLNDAKVQDWNTSPPAQRTWVGLTDEERKLVRNSVGYNQFVTAGEYAEHVQKATEFKLLEKNA